MQYILSKEEMNELKNKGDYLIKDWEEELPLEETYNRSEYLHTQGYFTLITLIDESSDLYKLTVMRRESHQ